MSDNSESPHPDLDVNAPVGEEPFAGLVELQRQMARSVEPLQEFRRQLDKVIVGYGPLFQELKGAVNRIAEQVPKAKQWLQDLPPHFEAITSGLARLEARHRMLDAAGLLPHYTTPFNLIDGVRTAGDQLGAEILAYYSENWASVRIQFEQRLNQYSVDDEAKATFREALHAHEAGLYRASCRVLFPELERVCGVELPHVSKKQLIRQETLQQLAGELMVYETEPTGLHALKLYEKLTDHLYLPVWTPEEIEKTRKDPVPNRHAAIHGRVTYSTMQNSINMLIMADYVLQVITAAKARGIRSSSASEKNSP